MNLPLYIVDAFTTTLFRGNPAAICPLQSWLPDTLMQQIAAENNLAETAFLVPRGTTWELRWFTPKVEVDLCGHATLASAFVLAMSAPAQQVFTFQTRSGELAVTRHDALFTLDFPARTLAPVTREQELAAVLGVEVRATTLASGTLIVELADQAAVQNLTPDFHKIQQLDCRAVSVTARGYDCAFVSRFFAPKVGVNEDAVTGSAHCALVPYWAARLQQNKMLARQLSARGGELLCELLLDGPKGDRVLMGGQAVLYSKGELLLPV